MRQKNQYFSVLFAALLLFQDIHSHLTVNFNGNVNESGKRETEGKDLVEIDTNIAREKSKYFSYLKKAGKIMFQVNSLHTRTMI